MGAVLRKSCRRGSERATVMVGTPSRPSEEEVAQMAAGLAGARRDCLTRAVRNLTLERREVREQIAQSPRRLTAMMLVLLGPHRSVDLVV